MKSKRPFVKGGNKMLEAKKVSKTLGDKPVLRKIDIAIKEGSIFGIVGINGAGKSTLLRVLSGVYRPDEGEVFLDGEDLFRHPEIKEGLFLLNDDPHFGSRWRVSDLLSFYSAVYPKFSLTVFEDILSRLKLSAAGRLSSFSKGMKRQLYIAVAFATGCRTLLLDEAFDGLDPLARLTLKQILVDKTMNKGLSCLISSHSLRELEDIADSFGILDDGRLIDYGAMTDFEGKLSKFQLAFRDEVDDHLFDGLPVLSLRRNGKVCEIVLQGDAEVCYRRLEALSPLLIEQLPVSFEEFFIAEVKKGGYRNDPKEIL